MFSKLVRGMKNRPILLFVILLLIVLAALALNNVVQDVIAPALLSWLWRVYVLSSGFPQMMTWAFFVALIPVIAIFSLIQGRPSFEDDVYGEDKLHPGQVQELARWIRQAPQGDYFKMRLVRHLAKLTMNTLEYRERLTSKEIRNQLKDGQMEIAPEVHEYLKASWRKRAYESGLATNSRSRRTRLKQQINGRDQQAWYDPKTEKVIQYLECELEVTRES